MLALLTGAQGQLGQALARAAPAEWRIVALARTDLDIADAEAVAEAVTRLQPDVVLNAAAFTAVDLAETQIQAAWRTNRDGARVLAEAADRQGAGFVHISTDFVFDGESSRPYGPDHPTGPLSVYGDSKLAGERAVLAAHAAALIVRTSWVYAPGGRNFVATMLRLMAEKGVVRVVSDQVGAPTSADSLARALWDLIGKEVTGVWHYSDAGVASWYDFAAAIAEEGLSAGLLGADVRVIPISTVDWPTPARRPSFSVLDCRRTYEVLGRCAPHWREALREALPTMKGSLA